MVANAAATAWALATVGPDVPPEPIPVRGGGGGGALSCGPTAPASRPVVAAGGGASAFGASAAFGAAGFVASGAFDPDMSDTTPDMSLL